MRRRQLGFVILALMVLPGGCRRRPRRTEYPLHYAASAGHLEHLHQLLSGGLDVNARDASGNTPLHKAASQGHVLAAQLLLAYGAQVDIRNDNGATALLEAAAADHELMATVLIEWGADVNVAAPVRYEPLYTALHFAARRDSVRLVRTLLAKGADPDGGDPITVRPVILAMQENRRKTVQILVEAGAQISAPVAAYLHDRVRLKAAIERGDDVNARVSQDRTGLHLAAEFGDAEMASLLCLLYTSPSPRDS